MGQAGSASPCGSELSGRTSRTMSPEPQAEEPTMAGVLVQAEHPQVKDGGVTITQQGISVSDLEKEKDSQLDNGGTTITEKVVTTSVLGDPVTKCVEGVEGDPRPQLSDDLSSNQPRSRTSETRLDGLYSMTFDSATMAAEQVTILSHVGNLHVAANNSRVNLNQGSFMSSATVPSSSSPVGKRKASEEPKGQSPPKKPYAVIDLTAEDSSDEGDEPADSPQSSPTPTAGSSLLFPEVIDVEEFEAKMESRMFRSLTSAQAGRKVYSRNPAINAPFTEEPSYRVGGSYLLKPGKFIEIIDDEFLRIKAIVRDTSTGKVTLRGWKAVRTKVLKGKLETGKGTKNELVYTFHVDLDDPRDMWEQAVEEVPASSFVKIRNVSRTNKSRKEYPCYRLEELPAFDTQQELNRYIAEHECMALRWNYIRTFANARERESHSTRPNNCASWTLRPLTFNECSPSLGTPAKILSKIWRREYELEELKVSSLSLEASGARKYTVCDSFCGAGGASRGAEMAGLKVTQAFDSWDIAYKCYKSNFPNVNVSNITVDEFCSLPRSQNIDVLHLSCPCQYFSPMHPVAARTAKNDDANYAASYAVNQLLTATRPRMVSSEQTFGLLFTEFAQNFNVFNSQFTDLGFAITWSVVEFQNYGLPQRRRRLLAMAAAPGETLPSMPRYTHDKYPFPGSGLKPLTTVRDVLRRIPPNAPSHDVHRLSNESHEAWNDNTIFPYTVCTQGLVNGKTKKRMGHPSGTRGMTLTEVAAIQGVPPNHRFPVVRNNITHIYKMIGNMYPSSMAKIQFTAIRKALEQADAAVADEQGLN